MIWMDIGETILGEISWLQKRQILIKPVPTESRMGDGGRFGELLWKECKRKDHREVWWENHECCTQQETKRTEQTALGCPSFCKRSLGRCSLVRLFLTIIRFLLFMIFT